MSLHSAHNYLITFDKDEYKDLFADLIARSVTFEVLDPKELGEEWDSKTISLPKESDTQESSRSGEMHTLASILEQYKPKGVFASLLDARFAGTSGEIVDAKVHKNEIMAVARNLHKYNQNQVRAQEIAKIQNNKKPNTGYLCGYNLATFVSGFAVYVESIVGIFNENHPAEKIDLSSPDLLLTSKNGFDIIQFGLEDKDIINMYIKDEYPSVKTLAEYQSWLQEQQHEILEEAQKLSINVNSVSKTTVHAISALHAAYEIDELISNLTTKVFSVDQGGALFCFVSIDSGSIAKFENCIGQGKYKAQEVNWNKEIFNWDHKGGMNAFQGIAQSIGTIDTKEIDPTPVIAVFFSVFFAFCLADALYGLLLALFCGYFLIFERLKPGLKNIFRIFAISGLATVVFGVLTNSYAGDLFTYLGYGSTFERLQLINILDPNAPVPINQFLKNNGGTSPIVALLGTAVAIGILNLLIAYVLKIITSIKSQDSASVLAETSWLVFVLSIMAVITGLFIPFIFPIALGILGISLIGLFVFNAGKGIFGKTLGGLGSLYGLIGLSADMLSYTRLVAVGLTGGIIANVINLLAELIYSSISIPVINVVAAIAVLLVGHTFNIIVSLFGAYINPLRLHYVEFLPKFYEGRGRKLTPSMPDLTFYRTEPEMKPASNNQTA